MRLGVIGTGYVGLVAGAGFSDFGNDVVCADVDADKIARLLQGEIPIYEPGLEPLVRRNVKEGRLRFTASVPEAVAGAEVVFIAVGTPQSADGSADMSGVIAAAEAIGRAMTAPTVVVTKSTVPVGTADRVREAVGQHARHSFAVVSNPEFLKEGDAVNDFLKPDRVLIGTDDDRARELLRNLYAPFVRTNDRIHVMDARSAELSKYAANAMLAVRISFMNEIANLAERLGADVEHVRRGIGADPRIGPKFLFPGVGYGGSCFPKDIKALMHLAERNDMLLDIVGAIVGALGRQKGILAAKMEKQLGDLTGRTVAVWGLSFKPNTDDIREAPAITLIDRLLGAGAIVAAYDPVARDNVRAVYGDKIRLTEKMYDALDGADALALVTEWHEFRRPDFGRMKKAMKTPCLFDGRNIWDPEELRRLGFTYQGIGRR